VAERRGLVIDAAEEVAALVSALAEELAIFRQRAQKAEARTRELEAAGGSDLVDLSKRITELEAENSALRGRIATASERTEELLDRVRFTRQQQESAGEAR
jgi:predicted RNase H-like nuclease (RuvC/YqgF family)